MNDNCPLCRADGEDVVFRDDLLRVVLVDDADHPGFVRVIVNAHVREMTDLAAGERIRLMATVFAVERVQRAVLAPDKINLASLGNVVPHLHWHVIPRFADDAHFPDPVWSARRRDPDAAGLARRRALMSALREGLLARLPPRE